MPILNNIELLGEGGGGEEEGGRVSFRCSTSQYVFFFVEIPTSGLLKFQIGRKGALGIGGWVLLFFVVLSFDNTMSFFLFLTFRDLKF